MTNKERYQQAFSVLHSSGQFTLEVEDMEQIQKTQKKYGSSGSDRKRCHHRHRGDSLCGRHRRHSAENYNVASRCADGG